MRQSSIEGRRRSPVRIGMASALIVAYVVTAYTARGNPAASVKLNDASVWIVRSAHDQVARLNHQIDQLDAQVTPRGQLLDVLQEGSTVFTYAPELGDLRPLDVAGVSLGTKIQVPVGASVSLGGGTLVVAAADQAWVLPATSAADFSKKHATLTGLGSNGTGYSAIAGADGVAHAYSATDQTMTNVTIGSTGIPVRQSETMPTGRADRDIVVSAVGSIPVVLDQDAGTVTVPGHQPVKIPMGFGHAQAIQIQQPGPANSVVYVASNRGLYTVPLGGGPAARVAGRYNAGGDPAAPVFNSGCAYVAWAKTDMLLFSCPGGRTLSQAITDLQPNSQLVFRVNRNVVVLNDAINGQAWIEHNGLEQVADWNAFENALNPSYADNASNNGKGPHDFSQPNRPPTAVNVSLGARPGRTTDLPVPLFDSDPNGDVITLVGPASLPASEGALQIADNGTVFQFTPAPGLTGVISFPYTITDGHGGNDTASATVIVAIEPPGVDTAPVGLQAPTFTVTQGKTIQFDALGSWYDHEGDPFSLVGVTAPPGDAVSFTPAGEVTFFASGAAGAQMLTLDVADSFGQIGHGTVTVDIGPAGQLQKPTTVPFLAQATAGEPTVLRPLSADSDPNDVPLRLASMTLSKQSAGVPGLEATADYSTGEIQFLAPSPGTYYLQYVATDVPPVGSAQSSAPTNVRVDVADPAATGPPVAMDQVAHLAPGGSTLLPVLESASDPAGHVLVVQSVSAPPIGSPVQASVYQGSQIRLTATSALIGPERFEYTITDGTNVSTAQIDVLSARPPATVLPPVAEPTTAVVRAGDVAQIDPLVDDLDPQGDPLSMSPGSVSVDRALSTFSGSDDGDAFIDGGIVRFRAPTVAGQATILYGVTDSTGQKATSTITVTVTPDQAVTQPPAPEPLTASVTAGSKVVIPVPLAGIDPSGESVTLIGPSQGPALGRVISVGVDSMTYQAFRSSSGTDAFDYAVRNRSGLVGDSLVRVGVAAAPPIDAPPVAAPQLVTITPGKTVDVPVLTHDYDPQGYAISFDPNSRLKTHGTTATIVGSDIEVVAPASGRQATVDYTITDGHGATAPGVLTVVADPSPNLPPVARDIVIASLSNPTALTVPVDILSHVTDPDGSASDLRVIGFAGGLGPAPSRLPDGWFSIHLANQPQVIEYTVTGADGNASATITVPARNSDGPVLRPSAPALSTPENTPVTMSIDTYVVDPGGKPLRLTAAADVSAAKGTATVLSPTSVTFRPDPGYAGPASLTITVTNGSGTDDPTAQTAVFTLPISVTGANIPPTFYGPTVSAVLGQHASFDLSPYIDDPNPGGVGSVRLSAPLSTPPNLGASISGQTLDVFPRDVPVNSTQVVTFTLTAGNSPPVIGQVDVVVTSTTRPLAVAVPQVAAVFQGKSVMVAVLQQDVDPFTTPLVVSSPRILSGMGTATTNGSTVTFTAGTTFAGTAVVQYTLTDQTKDPARQVQGTITVTVSGVPGAPGAPNVLGFGNGTVLLSWSAPPNNGQPITDYVVSGGPATQDCGSATTCTITSLQNGTSYQFTVLAKNLVGPGPGSQPSAPVTPNILPEAPLAPTATFEDGAILVKWGAPGDLGSPITCYQVAITPATGSPPACVTGLSFNWTGLTNGDAYTFTVRAQNALGWGPTSAPSQPEIPAGVPTAPAAPQVQAVPNDPTGQKLDVQWQAITGSAANGDPVSSYALTITQGATVVRTDHVVPTSSTENPVTDEVSGLTDKIAYTFTVTATNKAGTSAASPGSAPFTVFGQPGTIADLSAKPNQNQVSTLSFTPPDNNGQSISSYQVSVDGGGFQTLAANDVVSGLKNGVSHTFVVEACNAYCGAPSNQAAATPDAPPTMPGVSGSVSGITFHFSWGSPVSNGCPVTSEGWSNGSSSGPWNPVGVGAGSTSIVGGYSRVITLFLHAQDSCGLSATSSGAAASGPPPPPVVSISIGASANGVTSPSPCTSVNCYWVNISGSGFSPNTSYTFTCWGSYPPAGTFWTETVRTNGGGGFSIGSPNTCYFGWKGYQVYVNVGGTQSNTLSWP